MGNAFGLFVLIHPSGGKLRRFKYRVDGSEKKRANGAYPVFGLAMTDSEPVNVFPSVRKIERMGQLASARRTLQLACAASAQRERLSNATD